MARTRGAARQFLLPVLSLRRLKELAHKHGPDAIEELARLARKVESEAGRVAACREILDRTYGKAMQPIEGNMTYGISQQLSEIFAANAGNTLGAEIARRADNWQRGMLDRLIK